LGACHSSVLPRHRRRGAGRPLADHQRNHRSRQRRLRRSGRERRELSGRGSGRALARSARFERGVCPFFSKIDNGSHRDPLKSTRRLRRAHRIKEHGMAEITAAMVKELRELTGLGMMECKKALTETDGDLKKAEDLLRIKSGAKASKAASRVA